MTADAYTPGGSGQGPGHAADPGYREFPVDLLPPVVREYVRSVSGAMNCDPAYSALPALAVLGAAVGTSHVLSPKSGWREPPFVFAVTVGPSGAVKSPPYKDVEDVAEDLNDELDREHKSELAAYEEAVVAWQAAQDAGGDPGPKPRKPARRAFFKSDVTIEALVGVLQDNPRGVLVGRDELSGWVNSFVKYSGKGGATDLPQWLQLSNAGTVNYARKTGTPREVRVRGVGVSVCGTTQPRVLARAMTPECREAGLLARLLLACPPRRRRVWTEAEVDGAARAAFTALVGALFRLPPGGSAAAPAPHVVRLGPAAKALFVEFYNANGAAMEAAGEDEAAARSKLEGYALRFALIFHCCRHAGRAKDEPVAEADMRAAVGLTEWFVGESARVYAVLGETAGEQELRELGELVARLAARSDRPGWVTARDLQRHNARKYTAESAREALERLVKNGLAEWEADGPGQRRDPKRQRYLRPSPTSDSSDKSDSRAAPRDSVSHLDQAEAIDSLTCQGSGESNPLIDTGWPPDVMCGITGTAPVSDVSEVSEMSDAAEPSCGRRRGLHWSTADCEDASNLTRVD